MSLILSCIYHLLFTSLPRVKCSCVLHISTLIPTLSKTDSPLFLPVLYFFRVFSLVQLTKVGAWELSNPFFISIFLFWLCPSACEVLVPQPVIKPVHWEHGVNHCTIRVVPISIFKLVICSPNFELLLGTRNCGARLMSCSHCEALLKTVKPMGILGKGCPLAEIWKVLQTFKVSLNIFPDVFPKGVT